MIMTLETYRITGIEVGRGRSSGSTSSNSFMPTIASILTEAARERPGGRSTDRTGGSLHPTRRFLALALCGSRRSSSTRRAWIVGHVGVLRDITRAKEAELRLAHDALHDPLTGLPNRGLFLDRVALAVARTQRTGAHVAVLCLDLDHFGVFNDARGDAGGDELLRAVADRLRTMVRVTDTVTRFGADEYGLVCENVSTAATAAERAQRYLSGDREAVRARGRRGARHCQYRDRRRRARSGGGVDGA